jgi:hypothetical protein
VLAVGLVLVVVATLGWPGSPVFEARSTLVNLGLPSQLALLGPVAILLILAVYGRVLVAGLLVPGASVEAATGERLQWPAPATIGTAEPAAPTGRIGLIARALPGAARRNRTIRASLLVLTIAAIAVALAAGGFGAAGATQTGIALDQTLSGVPGGDNGGPTPGPNDTPLPTEPAAATPTAAARTQAAPSSSAPTATAAPRTTQSPTATAPSPTPSGSVIPTTGD